MVPIAVLLTVVIAACVTLAACYAFTARIGRHVDQQGARFDQGDRIDRLIERFEARFDRLSEKIDTRLNRVDARLDRVDGRLDRLVDEVAGARGAVVGIDARVTTLEQR
jgi:hypothetical protein